VNADERLVGGCGVPSSVRYRVGKALYLLVVNHISLNGRGRGGRVVRHVVRRIVVAAFAGDVGDGNMLMVTGECQTQHSTLWEALLRNGLGSGGGRLRNVGVPVGPVARQRMLN